MNAIIIFFLLRNEFTKFSFRLAKKKERQFGEEEDKEEDSTHKQLFLRGTRLDRWWCAWLVDICECTEMIEAAGKLGPFFLGQEMERLNYFLHHNMKVWLLTSFSSLAQLLPQLSWQEAAPWQLPSTTTYGVVPPPYVPPKPQSSNNSNNV
jgi:hypothetical protein